MEKSRNQSPGFIMLLALMILSIMVLAVTYFSQRAFFHSYFDHTILEQQQARQLARNGIAIAMSILSPPPEKKEKAEAAQTAKQSADPNVHFLKEVMPLLNRWQEFPLKKDIDGVDGLIKICISCEEGKISLNKLFDFSKHSLASAANNIDPKSIIAALTNTLKSYGAKKAVDEALTQLIKKRSWPFNDATELAVLPDLPPFLQTNFFYIPPEAKKEAKSDQEQTKPPVYLMDLFTVWNTTLELTVWALSDSVCALFGLKRTPSESDLAARKKLGEEIAKGYKAGMSMADAWKLGGSKLYGKEFASLPKELTPLLSANISAKTFSVVSYGTSGLITQKLVAIIQQQDTAKFVVKKLYWI